MKNFVLNPQQLTSLIPRFFFAVVFVFILFFSSASSASADWVWLGTIGWGPGTCAETGGTDLTTLRQEFEYTNPADLQARCSSSLDPARNYVRCDPNGSSWGTGFLGWPNINHPDGQGSCSVPGQFCSSYWTDGTNETYRLHVCDAVIPTYDLTVNSSGASNVVITSSTGDAGTTNYTVSGKAGTDTAVVTAPATSGGQNFSSWTGCSSTSNGGRTCTRAMSNANRTITANYTAPVPPAINVSTSSLSYGDVNTGSTRDMTFTVSNTGGGTVVVNANPTVTGTHAARYTCISANCSAQQNITSGSPQTYTVRYAPTAVSNNQTATLNLTGTFSRSVSLTGNGTSLPPPPLPPTAYIDSPLNPPAINYGSTYSFSWGSSNADSCELTRVTDGVVWSGLGTSGSTTTPPLTADAEYSIRCWSGAAGAWSVDSDNLFITVNPAPTVTLSANPTSGVSGYLTDVTYNAAGYAGTCDTTFSGGGIGNWGGPFAGGSGDQTVNNVGPITSAGVLSIWCDLNNNTGLDAGERGTQALSVSAPTCTTGPIVNVGGFTRIAPGDDTCDGNQTLFTESPNTTAVSAVSCRDYECTDCTPANSFKGVTARYIDVTCGGVPPPLSPTAAVGVIVDGGTTQYGDLTGANAIDATNSIEIEWGSNEAGTCSATAGAGFATGGATNGVDLVDTPTQGTSDTFTVNCDGATDSIVVEVNAQPNLSGNLLNETPSVTFDPVTGAFDSVTITAFIENSTVAFPDTIDMVVEIDRDGPGPLPYSDPFNYSRSGMAAGESHNQNVTFNNVPFGGTAQVRLTIDDGNAVDESNEGDNVIIQTIGSGAPAIDMDLTLDPSDLVRGGGDVDIDYDTNASFPMSCELSGPALATHTFDPSVPAEGPTGTLTAGPITSKSLYTLECTEPNTGTVYTASASVETTGYVEEI